MKVTNNSLEYLNLIKTIEKAPEQSDRVPDSIAPAPDLNPTGVAPAQNKEDQAAKSESAKKSNAAEESLIRSALELKYTKGKNGSQANESTGTQGSDGDNQQAEQATGNPLDIIKDRKDGTFQDPSSRFENPPAELTDAMDKIGNVYGNGSSGGSASSGIGGGGGGDSSIGSGGGGGESGAGGGSGSEAGAGGGGGVNSGMTPGQRAKFEEMAGYNQGPASAKSKMDAIESSIPGNGFEQRDAKVNNMIDSVNPFNSMQDPTAPSNTQGSEGKTAGKYGSKEEMFGDGGMGFSTRKNKDGTETRIFDDITNDKTYHSETTTDPTGQVTVTDWVATRPNDRGGVDRTVGQTKEDIWGLKKEEKTTTSTDPNGNTTTTTTKTETTKDENGKPSTTTTSTTVKPDGSTETTTTTPPTNNNQNKTDNPKDTENDEVSRGSKAKGKLDSIIGMDLAGTPKAPKTSGDVDPTDESNDIGYGGQINTAIGRQGKTGLIGQPVDRQDQDLGGSGNLSMGGDVDFEDKAGYMGPQRLNDPADVNTDPYDDEPLPPAANQPTEESSEESDKSLAAQLLKNLRIKI